MLHRRVAVMVAFTGAALVVILTGITIQSMRLSRLRSWYVSCHNHRGMIESHVLLPYSERNNGALPHEAGVPGYAMFAKACAKYDAPGLNCNHGAPDARLGGWQAVNLPPEKWSDLLRRWGPTDFDDAIPFAWCGKPTGMGERVVICVFASSRDANPSWSAHTRDISEEHLEEMLSRLNSHLQAMGEPAVSIDVPDNIDWSIYEIEDAESDTNEDVFRHFDAIITEELIRNGCKNDVSFHFAIKQTPEKRVYDVSFKLGQEHPECSTQLTITICNAGELLDLAEYEKHKKEARERDLKNPSDIRWEASFFPDIGKRAMLGFALGPGGGGDSLVFTTNDGQFDIKIEQSNRLSKGVERAAVLCGKIARDICARYDNGEGG